MLGGYTKSFYCLLYSIVHHFSTNFIQIIRNSDFRPTAYFISNMLTDIYGIYEFYVVN
jgi:hypothetical protein